jgi:hypothetical protein
MFQNPFGVTVAGSIGAFQRLALVAVFSLENVSKPF